MATSRTGTLMSVFKYPVPRLAAQIANEWSDELGAHLGCPSGDVRERPEAVMRFPLETVRMELMDGSAVEFRCAFFIVSKTKKAVAVFTEHCGYHVFPYHEAKVFVDGRLVYEQ
jgi:hypothetical protein